MANYCPLIAYIKYKYMTQARILPNEQSWLIDRMIALGYPADQGGVCFGIAQMAKQAILANDLKTFDARLERIHDIPLETFTETVYASLHKDEKTPDDELICSILPFFDGVELYHQPHLHKEIFSPHAGFIHQNTPHAAAYVTPALIQSSANPFQTPIFSGIYCEAELQQLLVTLQHYLNDCLPTWSAPVALTLNDHNHGICIGYCVDKKSWSLVDVRRLTSITTTSAEELAQQILISFRSQTYTCFSTQIHGIQSASMRLSLAITKWKMSEAFCKIHAVTAEKSKCVDAKSSYWVHIAARSNQPHLVSALLKHLPSPDVLNDQDYTPLTIACCLGHDEVSAVLLKHRANPHYLFKNTHTPLQIATELGHDAIARQCSFLLEHGYFSPKRTKRHRPPYLSIPTSSSESSRSRMQ